MKDKHLSHHGTALGYRFEDVLKKLIPTLEKNDENNKRVPDFDTPRIGLEAKVTFGGQSYHSTSNSFSYNPSGCFGIRIKPLQIEAFPEYDKPVFYALGFHGVYNSSTRFYTISDRRAFMIRNFHVKEMVFVDDTIIQSMYVQGVTISETLKKLLDTNAPIPPNTPGPYFCIKDRHLRQIKNDEIITLKGVTARARQRFKLSKVQTLENLRTVRTHKGHHVPVSCLTEGEESMGLLLSQIGNFIQ
jgi:hypothetical protein